MFALVRHGHAGDKASWTRADELRPLTERGRQQAAGLAVSLEPLASGRLLTSPHLRCRQSLMPLAAATGRQVETCELLGPGADARALDAVLRSPEFEGAVFCTHGEVIKKLMKLWRGRGRLELSTNGSERAARSTEKGAGWIVVPEGGAVHAEYVRPVHVGPVLHEPLPGGGSAG